MPAGLGLTLPLAGQALADLPAAVSSVADAGYTEVWTSEASGPDAFSPLVATSVLEPRLGLGTAIAGYLTRGPALLAQQSAALANLAPGRTTVGIGSSSLPMVKHWNGLDFDRRLSRARDVLTFLRQAFAGERVDGPFATFDAEGFRLAERPVVAPKVLLAALGPKMLELACKESDGVILNWVAPTDVRHLLHEMHPAEVVCRIMVAPDTDAERVMAAVRRTFVGYLNVPTYRAFQTGLGRQEQLAPMWEAWDRGDRGAALSLLPDNVIDELVVHGTPEHCAARLHEYVACGVTKPVVAHVPTADPSGAGASLSEPLRQLATHFRARDKEHDG